MPIFRSVGYTSLTAVRKNEERLRDEKNASRTLVSASPACSGEYARVFAGISMTVTSRKLFRFWNLCCSLSEDGEKQYVVRGLDRLWVDRRLYRQQDC